MRGSDAAVSVGEDGKMCFVNLDQNHPMRVIREEIFGVTCYFYAMISRFCLSLAAHADSCTMNAVTYIKQSEVAVVNSTGQLKVFDVRNASDAPSRVFQSSVHRFHVLI